MVIVPPLNTNLCKEIMSVLLTPFNSDIEHEICPFKNTLETPGAAWPGWVKENHRPTQAVLCHYGEGTYGREREMQNGPCEVERGKSEEMKVVRIWADMCGLLITSAMVMSGPMLLLRAMSKSVALPWLLSPIKVMQMPGL